MLGHGTLRPEEQIYVVQLSQFSVHLCVTAVKHSVFFLHKVYIIIIIDIDNMWKFRETFL